MRPVALVTGASRGIGKGSAIRLAEAGFDVAVAARTLTDGSSDAPGGLDTTAEAIEAHGAKALPVRLDLLERDSVVACAETTLSEMGRIDLLLNNGIYQGPASMQTFMELDEDEARKMFEGNVFAQLALTRVVLPHMIERGSGVVLNMISASAYTDPPGPIGKGGWGMAYAMTKAAFSRVTPHMQVEHGGDGIRFVSIDPGFVITERAEPLVEERGYDKLPSARPDDIGRVVAWLATAPEAEDYAGQICYAQRELKKRGL